MPEGGCDTMGSSHWSSLFLKHCTLWKGPTMEKLVENCLPWVGPHAGAGEESEEEGMVKTMCDG